MIVVDQAVAGWRQSSPRTRSARAVATMALVAILVLVWVGRSEPIAMLALVMWTVFASAIAVVDAQEHRIPNSLVAYLSGATCLGLTLDAALTGNWARAAASIGLGVVGVAIALLIHVTSSGGLGMGDVKLMFPVVALLSRFGLEALFTAYVVAVASMALTVALQRVAGERRAALALAPYAVLGTWSAVVLAV